MEKKDFKNMSNSEVRIAMETLKNEYEAKKATLITICDEMELLENEYKRAEEELRIRKNIVI